jgi:hypothetical protein
LKRRTSRRISQRILLESLESRLLLSSTLLSIPDRQGVVEDPTRNLLYVLTPTQIDRVDLATAQLLSPIPVAHTLNADITPDGHYLYATDSTATIIHKIDLGTFVDTPLAYSTGSRLPESSYDIAITNQGFAVFDNRLLTASGFDPLQKLDLATGAVSTIDYIGSGTKLFSTPDRSTIFISDADTFPNPFRIYQAESNSFSISTSAGSYGGNGSASISADGALVAQSLASITIRDASFQLVKTLPFTGAVAFSPSTSTLFVAADDSSRIIAYDTASWQPLYTLAIGETFDSRFLTSPRPLDPFMGAMNFSADGSRIFFDTAGGVRIITTSQRSFYPNVDLTVSPGTLYSNTPIVLSAAVTSTESSAIPTGTVTFFDGNQSLGTANLVNGMAQFTIHASAPIAHSVTAVYNGDSAFNSVVSNPLTYSVAPVPMNVALTANRLAPTPGQTITLTATVTTASGPLPAGNVYFTRGNADHPDETVIGQVNIVGSRATLTITAPAGDFVYTAHFHGALDSASTPLAIRGTHATVIDLLALYTPHAETVAGGTDAMLQHIADAVFSANTAFANSNIPVMVRLVDASPTSYNDSGNLGTDLSRLDSPADGFLDNVGAMRSWFGADLTVLFVGAGTSQTDGLVEGISTQFFRGTANPGQHGFAVVDDAAPSTDYVFAHELGHLLGATHAMGDPQASGATVYAYGYRFEAGGTEVHDIMAYAPGAAIPYYSNPNVSYLGTPTGTATANAARTITEFAPLVAAYRTAPSVVGSFDSAKPAMLTGWAVDPLDTETPVRIRIDIDGITRATVTADVQRNDLVPYFGSANHGFSYTPAGLTAGHHTVKVYALHAGDNAGTLLGVQTIDTPIGFLDIASATRIAGWAIDRDTPASSTTISVSIDGAAFTTVTADINRQDLVRTYGSANHGFDLALPALTAGIHRIDIYAADTDGGGLTLIGSRTVSTVTAPTGWIDALTPTTLAGWAFSADAAGDPIQVRYTIDHNAPRFADAGIARADLAGPLGSADHGFSIALPALTAGTHSVSVDALNPATGSLTHLGTRTLIIKDTAGTHRPIGALDVASNSIAAGWAYDADSPLAALEVRIDVDSVPGTPFLAPLKRPDLFRVLGSGTHGFYIALPALAPGNHRIDLYAYDTTTHTPTLIASKNTTSAAPVAFVDVLSSDRIAGWAFAAFTPDSPVKIRVDVDDIVGVPSPASLVRLDLTVLPSTDHAFNLSTMNVSRGSHRISLYVIDPVTADARLLTSKLLNFA